jgi:AcrR family transcriptional regulator
MTTDIKPRASRMSAEERREEILEAAMIEFARKGLHGTSTETIAERVGISQPYLFRLFGTKKGLFLAAVERGFDRVQVAFARAVEDHPDNPLKAMGETYFALLPEKDELLLQMQSYAASSDPEVRVVVARRFGELYRFVEQISGASEQDVREFFAHGMLLNVAAALDMQSMLDQAWVKHCLTVERA